MRISGLTLANGNSVSAGSGGAILNAGRLTLRDCSVLNNSGGSGGGAANSGLFTIVNCTFAGNESTGNGGALRNNNVMNVTNSTLHDNTAVSSGAIASFSSGGGPVPSLSVLNCTISGNRGTDTNASGGGILNGGTARVENTIVANNTAANGPDVSGSFTSAGTNLIGVATGSTGFSNGMNGDRVGVDPNLGAFANHGGPTDTVSLLSTSPARDAGGDATAPPTDQRGYGRAGGSDIGAFEFGGTVPTPTPTATPTPGPSATATPPPNRFANISTRLRVESGDNVLIGGFIVTGTMQKRIIARALGPSLPVGDKLADPVLELYDGNAQLIASNDNWKDAQQSEIKATSIPPANDLESAIVRNVDLGAYTAIVRDAAGREGVGLVEVYDLGNAQDSKLANISTRGRVLTADNVMIGGLIATGSHAQKVILRAIGPSLPVEGKLADPLLELYDSNGTLMSANDNWKDTQQVEIEATSIPPTNDLEAAIVTFLPPAPYTAVVRGVNETTGVALVEVYGLQ